MQQYTTEWAKEVLREHNDVSAIVQLDNLEVWAIRNSIPHLYHEMWCVDMIADMRYVDTMLMHPDGYDKSLVTREDLI